MPSSHLIFCRPLLLLPSIRVFSNESTLHMRWPKYWSFSFSIILSKEHLGLISFRIDWLDLLAVQGTLQHHSSVADKFSLVILIMSEMFIFEVNRYRLISFMFKLCTIHHRTQYSKVRIWCFTSASVTRSGLLLIAQKSIFKR